MIDASKDGLDDAYPPFGDQSFLGQMFTRVGTAQKGTRSPRANDCALPSGYRGFYTRVGREGSLFPLRPRPEYPVRGRDTWVSCPPSSSMDLALLPGFSSSVRCR